MKKMFDFSGTIVDDKLACKTAKKTDHTPLEKHVVIVLHVEHTPSTWRVFTSTFQNLILHTPKTSCCRPAGIMYAWLNFSIFDKQKKHRPVFQSLYSSTTGQKMQTPSWNFNAIRGENRLRFCFQNNFCTKPFVRSRICCLKFPFTFWRLSRHLPILIPSRFPPA